MPASRALPPNTLESQSTMGIDQCFLKGCVLLFAKAPVPGRVKTRLASAFGYRGAAARYRALALQTGLQVRAAWDGSLQLWCAPDRRHPWLWQLAHRAGMTLHVQAPGNLGHRMGHALNSALRVHPWALVIGADCAGVEPGLLRAAVDGLENGAEVVIGPAADGGYVFLGIRRPRPELFRAMPWGTARVMGVTRQRLRRLTGSVLELPGGWDVDTPADYRRLCKRQATGHWLGLTRR
ncbi:MAG: TIGR04282 family arsenosugar biosynthesis glycosyltransferase [Ectothiorhodospiraceae bacterium]|nr:TIGR04282 family arsenosugar biosynthesis glycosyltransferase [Ectothiorhodospiraceae bacterium]